MAGFNLPPGVQLRDVDPHHNSDSELIWERVDRAHEDHVARCLSEGKDWKADSVPIRPCTYPARPLNGGSLERALPKIGLWHYEPKYNGWRALVHAPSGTMFNRYGERLTIQSEFRHALQQLREIRLPTAAGRVEWFDCEALERRHSLGQGSLLVFDYIMPDNGENYVARKAKLIQFLQVHVHSLWPDEQQLYAVVPVANADEAAINAYARLKELNRQWRCPFYEGLVAKRADSLYPVQLRSATAEFAGWVKHRWAG